MEMLGTRVCRSWLALKENKRVLQGDEIGGSININIYISSTKCFQVISTILAVGESSF